MSPRRHHHERVLTASVYAIECAGMAIVAALYFRDSKHALAATMSVAAAGFAIATVLHLLRAPRHGRISSSEGTDARS